MVLRLLLKGWRAWLLSEAWHVKAKVLHLFDLDRVDLPIGQLKVYGMTFCVTFHHLSKLVRCIKEDWSR